MASPTTPALPDQDSTIPFVFFGYKRDVGVKFVPPLFQNTPYKMVSFLDAVTSREPFRYTPHNMGVVLETLHPRPKAFIVGIAIDPALNEEMETVWDSYVEEVLKVEEGEDVRAVYVPLPLTHFVDPLKVSRPPANIGWEEEMFRQLDGVFRPGVVGKEVVNTVPEN